MAVYWVTGKMRNGKGLFCSMVAKQFYRRGHRIAANYPLDTEKNGPGFIASGDRASGPSSS
ncbi:hypothetical protein AC70_4902 [Escherichia coli 2-210-07_S4_C1]|nr:hypothetical protein AC70_4902 [Escherichia coli 2-210-07_S4_C1]